MQRVAVVGTTGAGKTTFARQLSAKLGAPHIELDALHWGPNWTPATDFEARAEAALRAERWVVDGNYSAVQPLVLARADTVIWLDYSIGTKLGRLLRRTLRRVLTHEVLWGTNTESLRQAFSSRSSIFVWLFKTHWAQRRHYEALLSSPAHAHLTRIRLGEPGAAQRLIMSL